MSVKYKCKTILTSQKMPNGKYYDFAPGDVIDEKYIPEANIVKYLASGLLVKVDEGAVEAPAKKVRPVHDKFHMKTKTSEKIEPNNSEANNTETDNSGDRDK